MIRLLSGSRGILAEESPAQLMMQLNGAAAAMSEKSTLMESFRYIDSARPMTSKPAPMLAEVHGTQIVHSWSLNPTVSR